MQDKVMKSGKWEFDEEVTNVFDEMLSRSIPDYDNMRNLCFDVGKHFVQPDTYIMDIGCSNGLAVLPFVKRFKLNKFKLYDVSEPMIIECNTRYFDYIEAGKVDVENYDLRKGVPKVDSSLIMSILTLQFIPIEYRQKIIQSIYDSLMPGGCFLFVEKVLGNTHILDSVMVEEYYQMKQENQYTQEQIENKRKALEGVLVPVTENWNIELLKNAGFRQIDCFWRFLNFAGWVAVK